MAFKRPVLYNQGSKNFYYDNTTAPVTLTSTDVFALDGQRLVSTATNIYSPENDPYTKVQYNAATNTFTVTTKDNMVTEYGGTADSRFTLLNNTTTLTWAINKITDPDGNYISYNYLRDNTTGESRINEIKYTGNGNIAPYNSINFYYDSRNDVNTSYVAGYSVTSNVILSSIKVFAERTLVNDYGFTYFFDGQYSKLNQVSLTSNGTKYNPTIINWGNVPDFTKVVPLAQSSLNLSSPNDGGNYWHIVGDVNGDGLQDIAQIIPGGGRPGIEVGILQSNGEYSYYNTILPLVNNYIVFDLQVVDLNNDGKSEVLVNYLTWVSNSGIYSHQVLMYSWNGSAISGPIIDYDSSYGDNTMNYKFFYGDFDNNGEMDRIVVLNDGKTLINQIYSITINKQDITSNLNGTAASDIRNIDFDGDGQIEVLVIGSSNSGKIYKFSNNAFSQVYTGTFASSLKLFTGDMNGDSKTDFITYNNGWKAYYSTGTGFTSGSNLSFLPLYDPSSTPSYLLLSDLNSDGKSDIVYAYKNNYDIYISNGMSFLDVKAKIQTTSETTMTHISLNAALDEKGQNKIIYVDDINNNFIVTSFTDELNANLYVSSTTDGYNNISEVGYSIYTNGPSVEPNLPLRIFRGPMKIASHITNSFGQNQKLSDCTYSFGTGLIHVRGKGFLGFSLYTADESVSKTKSITSYSYNINQNSQLFYTWVSSVKSYKNNLEVSTITNDYLEAKTPDASYLTKKLFLPLEHSTTSVDKVKNFTTTTSHTFDDAKGRITEQSAVTTGGWTVQTQCLYETVSGNTSRLTRLIEIRTLNANTYRCTTAYTYNSTFPFRVASQSVQGKLTTTYSDWDSYGNPRSVVTSVTDAYSTPSRTNTVVYDTYGRFVTSSTDAANLTTTYNYRSDGALLSKTDPNGLVTSTTYSTGGSTQRSTTTLPDGNTVTSSVSWDVSGAGLYYTRKQVSNGNNVTSYFNAVGWKKKETSKGFNSSTVTTTMEYLDNGSLSTVTDNDGNTTTYDYTETYSRLHSVTGLNTNIEYSYSTNSTTESDKSFSPVHTKTSTVDAFGNVTQVAGTNGTVVYNYYGSGKIKDVTAGGATTNMTYDDMGNQLTLVEPNSGTTSYTYNGFGQLKTQTDAQNQITTMGYDEAGRCTTKTAGTIVETYTYSNTPGTKGLLLSTDRASTVQKSYTYDRLCRVKTVTTSGPVTLGPPTGTDFVITYTYNNAGQVSSIAYPTGLTVNYVYDAVGNLTQINNASDNTRIWSGDGQNARGQWTQYSLGNGLTTTWDYDRTYKMLSSIHTGTSGNATSIQNLGFVFNEHGQLTSRTDGSLSESFQYDDMDRLTFSQVAGKTAYTYTYLANGKPDNGNIYQTTLNGTYHYDLAAHPHAVSSVDGVANYTSASNTVTTSFCFSLDNKLTQAYSQVNNANTNDKVVYVNMFTYGPDGNRFRVDFMAGTGSGAPTKQGSKVYIDNNEFGYDPSGTNTYKRTIIYAPTGVCAVYEESGGVKSFYYIHTDYLGSWLAITDATGSVTNRYRYDAWGRPRNASTWELEKIDIYGPAGDWASMQPRFDRGYTGHETMWGLGFINMNGRVYDPYTQRFLSPDNYVQDPSNSQNYNRYSYCINNPLKYTDPSGELFGLDDLLIAAAVIWLFTSDDGYDLQKAISSIAVHYDVHLFSSDRKSLGMDISVGTPQLFQGYRYEGGFGYYWDDYGDDGATKNDSYSGWELRYGKEGSSGWGLPYHKFSHMHYEREGTEFDQDRDKITLGFVPGLFYMEFENDANMHDIFNIPGMPKHKSSDKHKTAEVRMHFMGLEMGMTDFTGNPDHYSVEDEGLTVRIVIMNIVGVYSILRLGL